MATGLSHSERNVGSELVLQSVMGAVKSADVGWTLGHEHLFVDLRPQDGPEYMDVDWSGVTEQCVDVLRGIHRQGVNLVVDWSCIGVGRNVNMLREVSRRTGVAIVCPTGIYKERRPPSLARASVPQLANTFVRELTLGVENGGVRAGFIKCAVSDDGPTPGESRIHIAAARAAVQTGATVSLHSPRADTALKVLQNMLAEGLTSERFVWAHAQVSSTGSHQRLADLGVYIQFDGISAKTDLFFDGPTDDDSMLDRVELLVRAGHGDRVIVATDATIVMVPQEFEYERDINYIYSTFLAKLGDRIGVNGAREVVRDNVLKAFGSRLPAPTAQ